MCGCVLQPFFCLCFKEGLTISKNDLQINEQIRDNEIRVVSADGEQLGVMSAKEAQDIAYEKGMDLVKIAPQAKPPVCKIMDYGKYKFELNKREKERLVIPCLKDLQNRLKKPELLKNRLSLRAEI